MSNQSSHQPGFVGARPQADGRLSGSRAAKSGKLTEVVAGDIRGRRHADLSSFGVAARGGDPRPARRE